VAAFVGLTGIQAGPIFLSALKEVGIGLFLGGIVVTLLPQLIGLSFGHFTLRMNPIILLGALAGGQTVTAAMAAVQERSGSPVAVLGYTPAYPVANILLTNWGSIIVYRLDVSDGSIATKIDHSGHFRLSLKNGSRADIAGGPVRANSRQLRHHRIQKHQRN
jgi:hypothetical protein